MATESGLHIVVYVCISCCIQVFRWRTAASIVWLLLVTVPVLLVFQVLSSCSLLHPFTWITGTQLRVTVLIQMYTCVKMLDDTYPLKVQNPSFPIIVNTGGDPSPKNFLDINLHLCVPTMQVVSMIFST